MKAVPIRRLLPALAVALAWAGLIAAAPPAWAQSPVAIGASLGVMPGGSSSATATKRSPASWRAR